MFLMSLHCLISLLNLSLLKIAHYLIDALVYRINFCLYSMWNYRGFSSRRLSLYLLLVCKHHPSYWRWLLLDFLPWIIQKSRLTSIKSCSSIGIQRRYASPFSLYRRWSFRSNRLYQSTYFACPISFLFLDSQLACRSLDGISRRRYIFFDTFWKPWCITLFGTLSRCNWWLASDSIWWLSSYDNVRCVSISAVNCDFS